MRLGEMRVKDAAEVMMMLATVSDMISANATARLMADEDEIDAHLAVTLADFKRIIKADEELFWSVPRIVAVQTLKDAATAILDGLMATQEGVPHE